MRSVVWMFISAILRHCIVYFLLDALVVFLVLSGRQFTVQDRNVQNGSIYQRMTCLLK